MKRVMLVLSLALVLVHSAQADDATDFLIYNQLQQNQQLEQLHQQLENDELARQQREETDEYRRQRDRDEAARERQEALEFDEMMLEAQQPKEPVCQCVGTMWVNGKAYNDWEPIPCVMPPRPWPNVGHCRD